MLVRAGVQRAAPLLRKVVNNNQTKNLSSNHFDEFARRRENPFRLTKWQGIKKTSAIIATPLMVWYGVSTAMTDEFF
ncbi:hypothetical protein AAVH_04811 [Aphelenchoides avenae]|nr:hypothetical protein AAVH_04811 [Aphelenchus avenae]